MFTLSFPWGPRGRAAAGASLFLRCSEFSPELRIWEPQPWSFSQWASRDLQTADQEGQLFPGQRSGVPVGL